MTSLENLINATIRADVRALQPYHVPDASACVKLDAMENPYHLPPALRSALAERLAQVALNRYPVPHYTVLKQKICQRLGVPEGFHITLGNGSDELIAMLAIACAQPGAKVLAAIPTFVMYAMSAQLAGLEFVGVPLQSDFSLDLPAMLAAIEKEKPAIIYLSYPNNPTGGLFARSEIETILQVASNSIVVVDEAYQPFSPETMMPQLPQYPNLVLMRTVSKLGLAGIRLGYLSAQTALLEQIEKVRPPYNVNVLTEAAADFALDHLTVFEAQALAICQAREAMHATLASWPGVQVYPSAANFLLIRVQNANDVFARLLARKVLVKNVGKMHALLSDCLRLTIGTPDENQILLEALQAALH